MAKKQSSLINMVLTLFVITTVAAVALGFVYYFTKEPIDNVKKEKLANALKEVLPEFDSITAKDKIPFEWDKKLDTVPVFKVSKGDTQVGTAVEVITHKGFGGDVKLLVGFDNDGRIFGYSVLEHKETAGLGSKMGTWFNDTARQSSYVKGRDLKDYKDGIKVSKDDKDGIDAITAATISSRAFCDALNKAYAVYVNTVGSCVSTDTLIIKDDLKCDTLTNVSTIRKTDENSIEVTFKEEGGQDNE